MKKIISIGLLFLFIGMEITYAGTVNCGKCNWDGIKATRCIHSSTTAHWEYYTAKAARDQVYYNDMLVLVCGVGTVISTVVPPLRGTIPIIIGAGGSHTVKSAEINRNIGTKGIIRKFQGRSLKYNPWD